MLRPRIIPCLLLHKSGLVKTQAFKNPQYVGDPINTVRILNEKEVDELMVYDIDASVTGSEPNYDLIEKLAAECRMPLCYGGGVTSAKQVALIVSLGVEKVSVSSAAVNNPTIITNMAAEVGSQSVVVTLDIKKHTSLLKNSYDVCTNNGKIIHRLNLLDLVKKIQNAGAGEIIINSVDRDGSMQGFDLNLAKQIKDNLTIPVTFLGGAGSLTDIENLFATLGIVGAAAGSLFLFKGKFRAVLINYPSLSQKIQLCNKALLDFNNI